ncbi:hypothetical protein [Natronorubrum tibetense]|uniref:Uncharacterized protein n=1 Tax=Natronorubrum tibetense GA33 TaxID=1114856 RepID=L9VYE9_9EURY|nr:hypothetical protein [Natronorubrum tibetense]ELY42225.1 hypothetical protein C496_07498 [Natronorubrum tibetense GA33]
MNRRAFVAAAVSGSALLAGCSEAEELASEATSAASSGTSLGDTAMYGDIEVTVSDSMTAEQFFLNDEEIESPGNGTFALFEVESHNTDITEREVPHVSDTHYETLEKEENTFYMGDINDIRVYGDGEGGHFPDVEWRGEFQMEEQDDGMITMGSQMQFRVDGEELDPYPVGVSRPRIDADTTVIGWVVGVIDRDATPALKINFDETEVMWEAND